MISSESIEKIFTALNKNIKLNKGTKISIVVRGGYHVDDLWELEPTGKELFNACRWVLTQDVSIGFRSILISFLNNFKYNGIAEKL